MMHRLLVALGLFCGSLLAGPALAQPAAGSVLAKVKNDGTMKVCYAQTTPDAYKDTKTGQWSGVFVDLTNELASWMKVKVEPVEVTFATVILALNRGDCDLFGASLLYNAPRAMEIDYIIPFAAKGMNAVVKAGNPKKFARPEDFNQEGITLAVLAGSRDYEVARRTFPKAKLLSLNTPTDIQLFESVRRGDADAAFANGITIRWWLRAPDHEWATIALADDFSTQPNGWAIRYGDPAWKDFLDAFARFALANNRAKDLYESYLSRDTLVSK